MLTKLAAQGTTLRWRAVPSTEIALRDAMTGIEPAVVGSGIVREGSGPTETPPGVVGKTRTARRPLDLLLRELPLRWIKD